MKTTLIAVAAFFCFTLGAVAGPKIKAGPWAVGIGKPHVPGRLMATGTTATTPQVDWTRRCVYKDGSETIDIVHTTTGSTLLQSGQLLLDAACTKITWTPPNGQPTTIYTTTGGADAVCTQSTAMVNDTNTKVANGATSGKLNLP